MSESDTVPQRGVSYPWINVFSSKTITARATTIIAAILSYPLLLSLFYWSGRVATQETGGKLQVFAWAGVFIFIVLALCLPVLGLLIARSHSEFPLSKGDLFIRRLAHLMWAGLPLYTATGVYMLVFDLPGWTGLGIDYAFWVVAWLVVFAFVLHRVRNGSHEARVRLIDPPAALRWAHGLGAAFLILIFIAGHLANHLAGLLGYETHKAIMDVLRVWYRSGYVEPVIIVGFVFMMATGMLLARYRTVTYTDFLGTLQTMSGVYLAAFLFSHMGAVLILARGKYGVDTDWLYATGAPLGLFAEPGNVRLIPHYAWVVCAFVAHSACGMRVVMLAHGVAKSRADKAAWSIIAAGAVLSVTIMTAMLAQTA